MKDRILTNWAMTRGVLLRLLKERGDVTVVAFVATEHAARSLTRALKADYFKKSLVPTGLDASMNALNRTLGKGEVCAVKILFLCRNVVYASIGVAPIKTSLIDRIDARNKIVVLEPGRKGPSQPWGWYIDSDLKVPRNEFTVLRAAEACMMRGTDRND